MSDLIDRQALKAAHGLGTDCADCKRDARSCQYDRDFSRMDFCEWIDDAPTASPWRRVEEELPKETKIVVTYGKGHVSFGYYLLLYDADTDKEVVEWFDYCGNRENVTHWMPIPEPPKEDAYADK